MYIGEGHRDVLVLTIFDRVLKSVHARVVSLATDRIACVCVWFGYRSPGGGGGSTDHNNLVFRLRNRPTTADRKCSSTDVYSMNFSSEFEMAVHIKEKCTYRNHVTMGRAVVDASTPSISISIICGVR